MMSSFGMRGACDLLSGKKFVGMLAKKTDPLCDELDPDKKSRLPSKER